MKSTAKTAGAHKPSKRPSRRERLLALLADGEAHSGERLAVRLRISRSAVWKIVGTLRELGVQIEASREHGYRLPHAVELYDSAVVLESLSPAARAATAKFDVLLSVDSTNRYLVDAPTVEANKAQVCVAEVQTAGRGRRGRSWLAPFGSSLVLSLAWTFEESPPTLSALSLAVGVAVVRALRRYGADSVQLKWPNDLVWRARKLGGILIELRGESSGPTRVVIGLGMNLRMPPQARLDLAEHHAVVASDLQDVLGARAPNRNALLAAIIDESIGALTAFAATGFNAFIDEWRAADALKGANVRVLCANETLNGVARGVDVDGALLVDVAGQTRRFVSGEVSLRASGAPL